MPKIIASMGGSITIEGNGNIIKFQGEAYLPGRGSAVCEIYSKLVVNINKRGAG